jgi:hypothetical protein
MRLETRLAQLEREQGGATGDGVLGVRRIDQATGTGPDVVTVPATGERLTVGEFARRYPRGLLVERVAFGTPPDAA